MSGVFFLVFVFFFFKQKTAYEMVRSDWSSDVCSSDLSRPPGVGSTSVARTQYPGGSRPGSRAVRPLCKVKRRLTGQLLGACSGDETFHYRVLPAAARFCPLWPTTSRTSPPPTSPRS